MRTANKQTTVLNAIMLDIKNGKYGEGGKMPTEAEYTERFKVSRQTIRNALTKLEQDGLITRKQGSGTYAKSVTVRRNKTGTIAVICTYISEYIFPSILRGVSGVTHENDYQMLISSTDNSIATERAILSKLIEHPVDGIIVEGTKTAFPNPNKVYYQKLLDLGIPMVFINGYYPDLTSDSVINVVTDDYGGSYDATKTLIAAGHKNICGIFKSDDMQGINRYSGYLNALIDSGVNMKDSNVLWFSTETKEIFLSNIGEFFSGIDKSCTGMVCYNDQIAASIISYIEDHPEYNFSSIFSFDECLSAYSKKIYFLSHPHPKEKLGTIAAEKLFNMINGQRESSVILPWEKI